MGFFGGGGGGTTPVNMVGASSGTAGTAGYVPAPAAGKNTRYLSSDASFGELPLLPQYKNITASRYITQVVDGFTAGAANPTINVRYFHLIYVPADGQVDVLAFRTGNAPSVAFNVHLALWQVNEDGTVGSYVIGATGSSGTAANTNINISVTSTNIVRGYYWMSFTSDTTTSGNLIATCATQSLCFYSRFLGGTSVIQQNFVIWNYTCLTSYNQTTHETFNLSNPSGLQLAAPQIAFQYV
jgi:hypothetical protein